jgi:hypothetical protein
MQQLQFGPEAWVAGRSMFLFRLRDAAGLQWTFCVHQETLDELEPDGDRQATFNHFRSDIYAAALRLVAAGDSSRQHLIGAADIKRRGIH